MLTPIVTNKGTVIPTTHKNCRGWTLMVHIKKAGSLKYDETLSQSGHSSKKDAEKSFVGLRQYFLNRL